MVGPGLSSHCFVAIVSLAPQHHSDIKVDCIGQRALIVFGRNANIAVRGAHAVPRVLARPDHSGAVAHCKETFIKKIPKNRQGEAETREEVL
jgi:hypothetical protein